VKIQGFPLVSSKGWILIQSSCKYVDDQHDLQEVHPQQEVAMREKFPSGETGV